MSTVYAPGFVYTAWLSYLADVAAQDRGELPLTVATARVAGDRAAIKAGRTWKSDRLAVREEADGTFTIFDLEAPEGEALGGFLTPAAATIGIVFLAYSGKITPDGRSVGGPLSDLEVVERIKFVRAWVAADCPRYPRRAGTTARELCAMPRSPGDEPVRLPAGVAAALV